MSYRRRSWQKLKRVGTTRPMMGRWTASDARRVAHWAGLPIPPKPETWGKPRSSRAA
jgi:hypothetical protein